MITLYIDSHIVPGFVLSWQGALPQYREYSIWDWVGFYMMHTFLNLLVESKFESVLSLFFFFGITHNAITFQPSKSYLLLLSSSALLSLHTVPRLA
jgi:hypothetical protein